jgi:hypothetical protein
MSLLFYTNLVAEYKKKREYSVINDFFSASVAANVCGNACRKIKNLKKIKFFSSIFALEFIGCSSAIYPSKALSYNNYI